LKPYIAVVDLTELPRATRRKICECEKMCDEGISITTRKDGMIMCKNDARKFLYSLIQVLDENMRTTWTDDDTEYLIRHIKEHGTYYGYIPELAIKLGKSYKQVKSKISRLRKKGMI